ncbi:MAG: thiazole synthase [Candidatus Omnitrophota bacterium]|jgi:thiazole synthase|nr:MAG: thiazole synthase [Candidatus Omnitrophota bacterium]
MDDYLMIGGRKIKNRFFLGTGKFPSYSLMKDAIVSSAAEVITVALRRVDDSSREDNILEYIPKGSILMTNTSGARNADEAVRIAHLARAAGCGDWIKIEIINDNKFLLPDNAETIKAAHILAKENFIVMPYINPDLMDAKRLLDAGASSIMPLGAPIGTNKGLRTKEIIKILIEEIDLPVIVDAGIGRPSAAAEAMEMGCSAVLVNTAIATANDPAMAARSFSKAVEAGRFAYLCGLEGEKDYPQASSPLTGFLR